MHDDQFTANGSTVPVGIREGGLLDGAAEGTQFEWGVRVLARRCGVVGQTTGGGVAGVYGHGRFSQFGVLGTAFGERIGVVGASVANTNDLMNLNVPPASVNLDSLGAGSGTGVFGKSGSGFGVHGMSEQQHCGPRQPVAPESVAHGASDSSTGVLGTSESGFGVHGISNRGPGGVFESKTQRTGPARAARDGLAGGSGRGRWRRTAGDDGRPACSGSGSALGPVTLPRPRGTSSPARRPFPGAPISENATGIDVKRIQMRLNMVFGTDLNGDGEFGPITRDAVVAFQEREQIAQTGVVDAHTWDRLFALT